VIKTTSPGCNRGGFELDPITTALVEAAPGILRTTAARIFAAGDVTGRSMVVHEAMRQALVAATNATLGAATTLPTEVSPVGSFTDLEYANALGRAAIDTALKLDTSVPLIRFG
jgi:pyruvate/2-oxoglutarate dehydrogenase complex dihydrolipoamide dehydrogenase (E3) component